MKSNCPILITSAIKTYALKQNKLIDEQARLNYTKNAIHEIAKTKIFTEIIIVDGTCTNILSDFEINNFKNTGIKVEQINFQQDIEAVKLYGKSNGEMQIMNYAVDNSEIIKNKKIFYKISGRYNVKNIKDIINISENYNNLYYSYNPNIRKLFNPFLCTIFFKTNVEQYNEKIRTSLGACSTYQEGFLESVYYKILFHQRKNQIKIPFPYFVGVGGTSALPIVNRYYSLRNLYSQMGHLAFCI